MEGNRPLTSVWNLFERLADPRLAAARDTHDNNYPQGLFSRRWHSADPLRMCIAKVSDISGTQKGESEPMTGQADLARTGRGTGNMIQAQRDFFGSHGFERTDREGSVYHGDWAK
jgi:6-phosphogluconate dehydrogenase